MSFTSMLKLFFYMMLKHFFYRIKRLLISFIVGIYKESPHILIIELVKVQKL